MAIYMCGNCDSNLFCWHLKKHKIFYQIWLTYFHTIFDILNVTLQRHCTTLPKQNVLLLYSVYLSDKHSDKGVYDPENGPNSQ